MPRKIIIPKSSSTVQVSVIDTTTWTSNMAYTWSMDPLYPGFELNGGPSYAFYIYHERSDQRLLFDLGLRKNYETHLSPHLRKALKHIGMKIKVDKDVADILAEGGVSPAEIDSIILSHHHFDHTGDTTKFPATTRLVVGPGFKKAYYPGYPRDAKAYEITSDLYEGRGTVELEFADIDHQAATIGKFLSYDYFDDGSFYLLSTPGHTVGHLSALARTTSDGDKSTFIFMGGDIVHSCMVFRPTEKLPLPQSISPAPNARPFAHDGSGCPGEIFASMHRVRGDDGGKAKSYTTPFCTVAGPEHDLAESQRSADELAEFDGEDDIFTIYAHDDSLYPVLDYFPKLANQWKEKGWKKEAHWRFLAPMMGKGEAVPRL